VFLVKEPNGELLVKVIDFGLARHNDLTPAPSPEQKKAPAATSLYAGTPEYFSPEQALQRDVGPAADLYAVGVMLFEMLSGQLPFSGNVTELLQQHARATPPGLAEVTGAVPEALGDVVGRLLAKRVEDRPASAQSLRYELTRIFKTLQGAGTQVHRVQDSTTATTKEVPPAPAPKSRVRVFGLAAVLVTGVVITALLMGDRSSPSPVIAEPTVAVPALKPFEAVPSEPTPAEPTPAGRTPPEPIQATVTVPLAKKPSPSSQGPLDAADPSACEELTRRRAAMLERFDGTKTALRAKLAAKSAAPEQQAQALKRADAVRSELLEAKSPTACHDAIERFERWVERVEQP